ncbi:hypothetical protein TRVA0_031S01266 [Trichomonascus vanleenenianus]|uniref:isocitrate lyase/PEP mutase family protein n=1 Tax=Trichomonascus vanleenenianus TaxID=2268995 RepID=UPI003EC96525
MSYPFKFTEPAIEYSRKGNDAVVTYRNSKGRIPTVMASRLRTIMIEARNDPSKIAAVACAYDGFSSRQIAEAGFPFVFLSGYSMAASMGYPDAGYIAYQDVVQRILEAGNQVDLPILVDGDTGYGGIASVYRTVQGFANAGAGGVMIEDQKWPKKCGHTRGKEVVDREEAFARVRAACAARDEGKDIFILARTDALILGYEEALARAKEFTRLGADAVFIEAMPDRATMERACKDVDNNMIANIIEGGKTENLSAVDLAALGFSAAFYPITLVSARTKATREALEDLKKTYTTGSPNMILPFSEVCEEVGFEKHWDIENRLSKP